MTAVEFTADFSSDATTRSDISSDGNGFLILTNALDISLALDAVSIMDECLLRIRERCHTIWETSYHIYRQDVSGIQNLTLGKDEERFVMQTVVVAVLNELAIVAEGKLHIAQSRCNPYWMQRTKRCVTKILTISKKTMKFFNTLWVFVGLIGSIVFIGKGYTTRFANNFPAALQINRR